MNPNNPFCSAAAAAKNLSTTVQVTGHAANVARMNAKNPHAVALGHMTSGAKAEAAKENGKSGGRPSGS